MNSAEPADGVIQPGKRLFESATALDKDIDAPPLDRWVIYLLEVATTSSLFGKLKTGRAKCANAD